MANVLSSVVDSLVKSVMSTAHNCYQLYLPQLTSSLLVFFATTVEQLNKPWRYKIKFTNSDLLIAVDYNHSDVVSMMNKPRTDEWSAIDGNKGLYLTTASEPPAQALPADTSIQLSTTNNLTLTSEGQTDVTVLKNITVEVQAKNDAVTLAVKPDIKIGSVAGKLTFQRLKPLPSSVAVRLLKSAQQVLSSAHQVMFQLKLRYCKRWGQLI